jgi:WD40 repeat protein
MTHISPITSLAALQDGRIVSGGYDGNVVCWTADLEPLWRSTLPDLVNSLVVSADQARVYVAAADGYAYALATATGYTEARYGPHLDDVNYASCPRGSRDLITVADAKDGVARVWDTHSGVQKRVLPGHPGGTFSAKFSPCGKRYATTGGDGAVRLWRYENGEPIGSIARDHAAEVVTWSHAIDDQILTGHADGVMALWNVRSGEALRHLKVASSTLRCIELSPDGQRLIVGGYDGRMILLDAHDWHPLATLQADFQWERTGIIGTARIYVGSFSSKPVSYAMADMTPSTKVVGQTFGINSLAVDAAGALYLAGDSGDLTRLCPDGTRQVLYEGRTVINSLLVIEELSLLVVADYRGNLKALDLSTGAERSFRNVDAGPLNCLAYDRTRGVIASGGYDGWVRIWSPSLDPLSALHVHSSSCKSVKFLSELGLMLVGCSDGRLAVLPSGGDPYHVDVQDIEVINDIAIHSRRRQFATASRDCIVRLWDATTCAPLECLPRVHTKSIKAIDIDEDSGEIITGGYDGSVVLWRKSGQAWSWKRLLSTGKPGVSCVRALGGSTFCATSWDGYMRRWNAAGELEQVVALNPRHGRD